MREENDPWKTGEHGAYRYNRTVSVLKEQGAASGDS